MDNEKFFWPCTQRIPQLASNYVHVWAWSLDAQPTQADWELLSEEEARRARRMISPRDCDRLVRAHSVMRTLLASYSEIPPAEIVYTKSIHGKPHISSTGEMPTKDQIRFNLSHSAGISVLAVSHTYDLGVDIELVRGRGPEVAERFFSPLEQNTLRRLQPGAWLRGFYRCWTSKEALLKGEGLGLNLPLDAFDVEADPFQSPALLAARVPALAGTRWNLVELEPTSNMIGTLAIREGECATIQCFSFSA